MPISSSLQPFLLGLLSMDKLRIGMFFREINDVFCLLPVMVHKIHQVKDLFIPGKALALFEFTL